MFPSRIPFALSEANALTLITAVLPSSASQVFPGPSGPEGHSMLWILLKLGLDEDGDASMCALDKGTGTRDDENGVAPVENGTLGLLVLLSAVLLSWNDAMNDPAKNKLEAEELVVMDNTSPAAPAKPPKGALDQELALGSHTATDDPGDANFPPTHTLLFFTSQYTALTSPLGPLDPNAEKVPEDWAYDAMLLAEMPPMDEKDPAT